MDYFHYKNGEYFAEDVPLSKIADEFGTPCYVYSRATLERHFHAFDNAFGAHPHRICYSVKANGNIAVLNILARLGASFDIVSGGELQRVLAAGGLAENIVFSGVGKSKDEIKQALEAGIHCFNVESLPELDRIQSIAKELHKIAPISFRVNPNVDAKTHPHIATGLAENKFGIASDLILDCYRKARTLSNVKIIGIDCHIGSQLTSISPFLDALAKITELVHQLEQEGIALEHIDLGGGLGAPYKPSDKIAEPAEYAKAIFEHSQNLPHEIILEPGRAIAGNAGVLIAKVEYVKETENKNFIILDTGMNDLMRPALYSAEHSYMPLRESDQSPSVASDIVGPVCETADTFLKDTNLSLEEGDLIAIRTAGAYGFVMTSNYNARMRPPEVMVDGEKIYCVRQKETLSDQLKLESLLP